jgi:hypothetical protein
MRLRSLLNPDRSPSLGAGALALGLWCTLLAAAPALAQGIPSAADAPREGEEIKGDTGVVEIREVERGLYVSVDAGPNYFLYLTDFVPANLGFVKLNEGWLEPGQRVGLRLGYDVLNNINIELYLVSNFNRGVVDPDEIRAGILTGDVAHFAPGIATRFAFITTERLFVYGRVGLGVAFWTPAARAPVSLTGLVVEDLSMGVHSDFSLGFEYYTKLRHLSIGFEVAAQGAYYPFAFGFQAYPTIKYTF